MKTYRTVAVISALLLASTMARAQLGLPSVNLPLPQRVGPLDTRALQDPLRSVPDVTGLRLDTVTTLLRRHRDVLEADPRGEPIVRKEILALSPSPAGLAAAARLGLVVVRDTRLPDGQAAMAVLRVPRELDTAAALAELQRADPDGVYDFNHVYTGSASGAPPPAAHERAPLASSAAGRVGLVDSGVDTGHRALRGARVERWGCAGNPRPAPHGTSVAALMVGNAPPFRGVAPSARLYAADIYCGSPTGGSVEQIAGALAWMAQERIPVVNMSLVGPPNRLLERVVAMMVGRGHLLVAAVGNDGPAAPPLYPASYPGVVGVTAVDRHGRPLPEAARGRQVMFAAPGNHMVSADAGNGGYRQVRGTSFAAPIVASLLAAEIDAPDAARARDAIARLAARAQRKDAATVSNELGYGIVGAQFRIDPRLFR